MTVGELVERLKAERQDVPVVIYTVVYDTLHYCSNITVLCDKEPTGPVVYLKGAR